MVRSDTAPYDYEMGACDNASRVVSYVVMMGQGYSLNPLFGMRIHDINVESEIIRYIPQIPEPVVADGSTEGAGDYVLDNLDPETEQTKQTLLDQMANVVFSWLSQWWPKLVGTFIGINEYGSCLSIQVSIDLLANFQIESLSYESPLEEQLTENQIYALQSDVPNPIDDLGGPMGIMSALLGLYWVALDLLVTFAIVTNWVLIGIAIAIFLEMWGLWLFYIDYYVNSNQMSLADARSLTLGFAFALAGEIVLFTVITALKAVIENGFNGWMNLFRGMKEVAQHWGVISFIVKLCILAVTYYQWTRYYDRAVQNILSGAAT
jgi:hypothetical protein